MEIPPRLNLNFDNTAGGREMLLARVPADLEGVYLGCSAIPYPIILSISCSLAQTLGPKRAMRPLNISFSIPKRDIRLTRDSVSSKQTSFRHDYFERHRSHAYQGTSLPAKSKNLPELAGVSSLITLSMSLTPSSTGAPGAPPISGHQCQ